VSPDSPLGRYQAGVAGGAWQDDPQQRKALAELTRIDEELRRQRPPRLWQRLIRGGRPRAGVRGLYLHGGVGRGKTFVMDLFFDGLPIEGKQRLHFHRFMGRVHAELAQLKDMADPLALVAEHFAERARVLCFDEFFVSDIGDAMLLGRLLEHLFARGVTLVATSNVEPKSLYRDGLQRARFLPAIAAIEQHCKVMELTSPQDYRLRALSQAPIYHQPLGIAADQALEQAFARLSAAAADPRPAISVNDREIEVRRRAGDLIWFDFDALCRGARAAADYIEIAQSFATVILSGVPRFGVDDENEARRFVHLVDEFYDRSVKLILSADAAPTELYAGTRLRLEFQRTASRLIEMQSQAYLRREHRP
jgi:cell division protein ZapE